MLYSAGFVCLNNPNDMTYIAAQGQSCIDLAFVTSSHIHQFEAHVEASLEKKHQHLVVGWDKSISRLSSRAPAVRQVVFRKLSIRKTSHVHSPKEHLMPPMIRFLGRSNNRKS